MTIRIPSRFSFMDTISSMWRLFIWHTLGIALFFLLLVFTLAIGQPEFLNTGVIIVYCSSFLGGILNTWILFKYTWTSRNNYFWESIASLILAFFAEFCFLFGSIIFGLPVDYLDLLSPWLAIVFLFPYALIKVFDLLLMIPQIEYTIYYPGNKPPLIVFDKNGINGFLFRLENKTDYSLVFPIEFGESINQVPEGISVAEFFHASLVYYMRQNPEDLSPEILYSSSDKKTVGWIFYQRKWFFFRKYIDPRFLIRDVQLVPKNIVRSNGETTSLAVGTIYTIALH